MCVSCAFLFFRRIFDFVYVDMREQTHAPHIPPNERNITSRNMKIYTHKMFIYLFSGRLRELEDGMYGQRKAEVYADSLKSMCLAISIN